MEYRLGWFLTKMMLVQMPEHKSLEMIKVHLETPVMNTYKAGLFFTSSPYRETALTAARVFQWREAEESKEQLDKHGGRGGGGAPHHHHRQPVQRRRDLSADDVDDAAVRLAGGGVDSWSPAEDELRQEDVEQRDGKGGILG